ncbi:hypothetical protein ACI3KY_20285, partial [Microbacterium sp. ZW T2_14]
GAVAGAAGDGTGGSGSTPIPTPSTPQGDVTVTAAFALTVHQLNADVSVSGVALVAPTVRLEALGNLSAASTATGSPATRGPPSGATIAAAVAITLADVTVRAEVGPSTSITADTLQLIAGIAPQNAAGASDASHRFTTTATAGQGSGGDLGVAGSVALSVVVLTTSAGLATGSAVTLTGADRSLTISASSAAQTTTRALLADAGAGTPTTGVGASFALTSVDHHTRSAIADGATVAGADDINVTASTADAASAVAQGSARGADAAVAPFAAVTLSAVSTTAGIGTGVAITLTGALLV